jgi:citrate synthase
MMRGMTIRSDIAWSDADHVTVRGLDLPTEILGHMDLGELAFLQLTGRRATPDEAAVFNAIVITLVEHGITPSALAARLTYAGAPESLQAAVAAGLCGLGSVMVGSMEGASRMLYEALPADAPADADLEEAARRAVAAQRAAGRPVPGMGHPIHKPVDPRTERLFQIAAEHGFSGRYVELMRLVADEARRVSGKADMPINATGALGALCCEMGFPWKIVRGFGVMARAIGLVGHLLEESEQPMAIQIWREVDERASAHLRP